MAYTIVNSFIPTSKYKLKAPYSMTPEYVTIHNTYNDASARNEVAYMARNNNVTGYHVAIDDKEAIQAIPFNRNAFHAGDGQGSGNRKSIGIEICYSKSGGRRYYDAEANAVEYVAGVLTQYGWGIDRIKWHRDWSGKHCPHRMIDEGRLDRFKSEVRAHMTSKPPTVAATPKPANPTKPKEDDELKFSSGSLKTELAFTLASKAHRQLIIDAALAQGYNGVHAERLKDGTIEDGDLLALAAGTIVRAAKK